MRKFGSVESDQVTELPMSHYWLVWRRVRDDQGKWRDMVSRYEEEAHLFILLTERVLDFRVREYEIDPEATANRVWEPAAKHVSSTSLFAHQAVQ